MNKKLGIADFFLWNDGAKAAESYRQGGVASSSLP